MKNWNLVSRANGISYWLLSERVGYLFDQLREIYQCLFQYIDRGNNKISAIWKKIRLEENSIVYYSCGKRSKESTKDWFVIELSFSSLFLRKFKRTIILRYIFRVSMFRHNVTISTLNSTVAQYWGNQSCIYQLKFNFNVLRVLSTNSASCFVTLYSRVCYKSARGRMIYHTITWKNIFVCAKKAFFPVGLQRSNDIVFTS